MLQWQGAGRKTGEQAIIYGMTGKTREREPRYLQVAKVQWSPKEQQNPVDTAVDHFLDADLCSAFNHKKKRSFKGEISGMVVTHCSASSDQGMQWEGSSTLGLDVRGRGIQGCASREWR